MKTHQMGWNDCRPKNLTVKEVALIIITPIVLLSYLWVKYKVMGY